MTEKGLYIQMFSIHGLVRAENLELGYDADTGGQIKYVVELCNILSASNQIRKIDLVTRLIHDKSYSDDYAQPIEQVNDKFRIVRIQCGGKKYIRKELLWPHLDEFVDKTINFIRSEKDIPDMVHGHYPDAGYVTMELSSFFGVPLVYTGHSMGRSKRARLLDEGLDIGEMNRQLKIDHRIDIEENILKSADRVITSTLQEIQVQYGLYRNQALPIYKVIPPGIGIKKFYPYYHDNFSDNQEKEEALYTKASITQELNRFFTHPDKPMILALCRPDKRKNIQGLVEAYGEDAELQAMANLAIFAGIRKDISDKEESVRDVLTQMLLLMDKYNLYGKMAIPKQHDFEHEVPELYRIAAEKKGVFVNPALTEPFGLTLLEALACGLPIVSTNDGGPRDIVDNCKTGTLVDPTDTVALASSIKEIIVHPDKWNHFSKNGILNTREIYSWESHAKSYCDEMKGLIRQYEKLSTTDNSEPKQSVGKRLAKLDYMLITDIDDTLLGGNPADLQVLMDLLEQYSGQIGFGVATGRGFESAMDILTSHGVKIPDIIISDVGSRISYGDSLNHDKGWETHISKSWNLDKIASRLEAVDYIRLQKADAQSAYKLSYYMEPGKDRLAKIHNLLTRNKLYYSLIYSQNKYLDILPYRASKGKSIRYLSYKWGIPLNNFLVCGDSGNDAEMLKGKTMGVVVGNYSPELEILKSAKQIYFAKKDYAAGMMEGMRHYQFVQKAEETENNDN